MIGSSKTCTPFLAAANTLTRRNHKKNNITKIPKMYTLVIVDMQPCWDAANDPATIKAVMRQVKKAKRRDCPIISVTVPYFSAMAKQGFPPTHACISRLLKGYKKHSAVTKRLCEDGASEVLRACKKLGGKKTGKKKPELRLCGVKTAGCLWALLVGLCREPDIKLDVVQGACNSDSGLELDPAGKTPAIQSNSPWHPSMWSFFEQLPNVRLISGR